MNHAKKLHIQWCVRLAVSSTKEMPLGDAYILAMPVKLREILPPLSQSHYLCHKVRAYPIKQKLAVVWFHIEYDRKLRENQWRRYIAIRNIPMPLVSWVFQRPTNSSTV